MPQKPSQASQAHNDRHAYIPPHVQEAMAKQVANMSPSHMKGYAGAFVQQNMMNNNTGPMGSGKVSGPPPGYRPVTNLPRKDHFHQYKSQKPSRAGTFASPPAQQAQVQPSQPQDTAYPQPQQVVYPDQQQNPQQLYPAPPPQTSYYPPQPAPSNSGMSEYDFFMNTTQQAQQKRSLLPATSSLPIRIGVFAGALVVLLIVFNIVKGLIAGPSVVPYYMSVMQDQQEIAHLAENALEQDDLSTDHQNFAATAQLSAKSSQTDLIKILAENNKKINPKDLDAKINSQTDEQLTTAAASGTYNSAFNEIMQEQLKTYKANINVIYDKSKGDKSKELLKKQYQQAELLTQQITSASTARQ